MAYRSIIEKRGRVSFPVYSGERVYMREFRKRHGLPPDLRHWGKTIDAMLDGVETDGPIYLMVDQAFVAAGTEHRRPGVHVDGYWHPGVSAHGGSGAPNRHSPMPSHLPIPMRPDIHRSYPPSHRSVPDIHQPFAPGTHASGAGRHGWKHADFAAPEAIILASSVTGARGYRGQYQGEIGDGGDCSRIDLAGLERVTLASGHVYAGNVNFLHESIPLPFDCHRTVVRLNVPGWTPPPVDQSPSG